MCLSKGDMLNFPIYLDHNSTTPCDPRVMEVMLPYFTSIFGNASSRIHPFGRAAEKAVTIAREQVASLIGAEPNEVVFTSGATESVNLAIKGVFEAYHVKGNHIITTNIEHKAILDTCAHMEKLGGEVTYLPVNDKGLIDPEQVKAAIKPSTILIAVMYANNEIGTLMPIDAIATIAKENSILFFTDATQAVGKVPVNVVDDKIDLMAFSSHKLYGPKGVGALYVRRKNPRVRIIGQIDGGGHERGIRSGTLNVPGIVGFGKACEISSGQMLQDAQRLSQLRNKLEKGLCEIEESYVNGDIESRLPQVTNLSFQHAESEALMMSFNHQIAVSSGSACTSATLEPSYVLKAIGLSDDRAKCSLRFSLGRTTTEEEIDFVIEKMKESVSVIRAGSPKWEMHKQGIEI